MRGVDYRSSGVPIALILTKPFENKRSLLQGLTRVGRFGDTCESSRGLLDAAFVVDRTPWR